MRSGRVKRIKAGWVGFAATWALAFSIAPALAHHVMGGRMPVTFTDGLLSGLGHPIIGLDHFAALVAVGCLAAAHRFGPALAISFVIAMILGVAAHVGGTTMAGAEIVVAISVLALGALMLRREAVSAALALTLFAVTGLVHGYALGESIYGAEPSPLTAYFIGLAIIQSAVALAAMLAARAVTATSSASLSPLRLVGAGIMGIGFTILAQQLTPVV